MAESYLVLRGSSKKVPVMFSSFPDGDIHAIVENIADCKGNSVLLFHRLYPNQNSRLVQLFLTLDVLKEHGAKDISVFVPYLPYSRQDKRYIPGEAISADALCRMLKSAGCTDLYTMDCHFMKGAPEETRGGLKVHNISVGNSLVKAYKKSIGTDKFDVVGPDSGSSYLTVDHGGKNMHKTRGDYKDLLSVCEPKVLRTLLWLQLMLFFFAVVILHSTIHLTKFYTATASNSRTL